MNNLREVNIGRFFLSIKIFNDEITGKQINSQIKKAVCDCDCFVCSATAVTDRFFNFRFRLEKISNQA